jgi:hypothetical protein
MAEQSDKEKFDAILRAALTTTPAQLREQMLASKRAKELSQADSKRIG